MGSSVEGVNKFQSAERATPEDSRFGQIIGNSPALEFVLAEVECVAPTDSTVLVLGETGTGKELYRSSPQGLHPHLLVTLRSDEDDGNSEVIFA